ncbi:putative manganese-dependent inorganic diphosphatase [Sinanaerobacter chloroacetimidivorans]|uniref:inorganic diphosphatase n=1 Tax=Sinanaerobacter chloroacetimidivorans TaxID=2818044 RepID=A0A8J7W2S3_9FIRM|nr:putative manganese-dependent inorganic diphosphatase [Sinanaerobacter chloroacetimidivorans]MBR0597830.1 putative manganese-dependent inorganic diphosphatase [Sinanaerobacter chloroacetimidivorans]
MKAKVLVVGHKNPDTDSICSAIAYADLKNKISDEEYIPKRAGEISGETKFVLNRFQVEEPEFIGDVGTQVKDIDMRKTEGVQSCISLKKAWTLMKDVNVATLPITNQDRLEGLISVKDIATANMDIYDNRILASSLTNYRNILETLDGSLVAGNGDGVVSKGKIVIAAANPDIMESYIEDGDLVILGNRYESQLCAIEMNAGCIIVCMGAPISITIQKLAKEKGCRIISTPHDTYTVARLINQSTPIHYFMRSENLVTFETDDYTRDIKGVMAKVRHRDFPVLDVYGKYCGMISRRSLLDVKQKKIILVDHNERSQSVDGLEDAEIMEIIDHHRLGSLETISPVFFRNQPVGCTATIIFQMYGENKVKIEPNIAGLLCAAIITDTLMFRSPTCTEEDRKAAEVLAQIAGIEIKPFAEELFQAGSNFKDKSIEEIIYQDFKQFFINGVSFGVGQSTFMNAIELQEVKSRLLAHFQSAEKHKLDMMFIMLTNIIDESTELLYHGNGAQEIAENAMEVEAKNGALHLKGVVSRKKQLLPSLMAILQQ